MNAVPYLNGAATAIALPSNIEAEAAFLGAVLIDNRVIDDVGQNVRPEHFWEPIHGRIFERILIERARGTVTPVTLSPYFKTDEALKALGGVTYLARLTADGHGLLASRELAEQIQELAALRSLAAIGRSLIERACDMSGAIDPAALLADAADEIAKLGNQHTTTPLAYEWAGDVQPVVEGFWLVDGFLPKSGPATIFGHPGSGKTFLALDIAASVASGRAWAGREVHGGPVIYIAAEGLSGFKNRLSAMISAGRLDRAAPFIYIPTAIDLQSPAGDTAALIATIKHFAKKVGSPPALIAIDTLSKTFGAGKENTDDMASYVANCECIAAAFDALTLIIHHRPRGGDNERGHSSLRGGVVTSIIVEGDTIRTATTVKQKDAETGDRIVFGLEPVTIGTTQHGKEVSTCLVEILDDDGAGSPSDGTASRRKLSGQKKIAFDALEVEIALNGTEPPACIPGEVLDRVKESKVIDAGQAADKLKSEFLATVNAAPDKRADTAARTARRSIGDLKAAGILGTWENWLWIA